MSMRYGPPDGSVSTALPQGHLHLVYGCEQFCEGMVSVGAKKTIVRYLSLEA